MERYKNLFRMKRLLLGEVEHEVTVRNINGSYHCRVFVNGELNQEAVCYSKRDIGYTCRNLLRWEDKCGNISKFASAARERLNQRK
jgi:hypothetical protein